MLLVLATAALLSLRPWESDSVAPSLKIPAGSGIGVDDAIALAPPAAAGGSGIGVDPATAAAKAVTVSTSSGSELGISAARPVSHLGAADVPLPPPAEPAPTPVALPDPDPEPAPSTESVPVATTAPAPSPGTVGTAGGGVPDEGTEAPDEGSEGEAEGTPVCEGDDYLVVAFLGEEEADYEEVTVDLLIERFEEGGEEDSHLEGLSLDEARSLVDLLVAAGGCEELEPVLF